MDLPRLILKFGGTSLRDGPRIARAGERVAEVDGRRPAVVVSAAGGVTDRLVSLLEIAERSRSPGVVTDGSESRRLLDELAQRHREMLAALSLSSDLVDELLNQLADLVRGIELLGEVTPRTRDLVLSYGEKILARIFAAHLTSRGIPARSWDAGTLGLVTDDRFTRARPRPEYLELIPATLRAEPEAHVPVITGFSGRTLEGQTTTLGRGGSDFSASLVGRALGVDEVQIWTDVDGILTADPRVVPSARLIEGLSFGEAGEIAYSGAKVLHPSTITPAMDGRIPVRVLNSLHPESPGTTIRDEVASGPADPALRAIAHRTGVQVITIVSPRMLARPGFIARIASVFERHRVSIDMISTSEVSVSLTTDEPIDEEGPVIQELREFATVEVLGERGMISIVGAGLGNRSSLLGATLQIAAETGARIEMISFGATRTNLSFLVEGPRVPEIVRGLHQRYFEG